MWCWRSPSDSKEIQPVNPKGNQPWIFIEGLMLKLKLQYFGYLMERTDWLEMTLMLGKIEAGGERDNRGWDGWTASPTQWTWVWVSSTSWWCTGKSGFLQSMGSQRGRHNWATELKQTCWGSLCRNSILKSLVSEDRHHACMGLPQAAWHSFRFFKIYII